MTPTNGTPDPDPSTWAAKWKDWPKEITVDVAKGDWRQEHRINRMGEVERIRRDLSVAVWHPRYPGWTFRLRFSGSGTMVGFEVVAATDGALGHEEHHPADAPPVTARFLRKVPIGEIESAARRTQLAWVAEDKWYLRSQAERYRSAFTDTPRPGRRGRDDRVYAEVAARYVQLHEAGSRRPVVDLAAELGYSASRVRNIVHEARRRGLLTGAPRGRHGGWLTPMALTLLEEED